MNYKLRAVLFTLMVAAAPLSSQAAGIAGAGIMQDAMDRQRDREAFQQYQQQQRELILEQQRLQLEEQRMRLELLKQQTQLMEEQQRQRELARRQQSGITDR